MQKNLHIAMIAVNIDILHSKSTLEALNSATPGNQTEPDKLEVAGIFKTQLPALKNDFL